VAPPPAATAAATADHFEQALGSEQLHKTREHVVLVPHFDD